jgi:phage terminase large subunit
MDVLFPEKFYEFVTAPKRFNVFEGGRGGAKSHTVAEALLLWGLERKIRVLCTREIQKSIKESVHQLLSDKIIKHKYPYRILASTIVCELTGSEFYFHGLQAQTIDNLKSFEGVDWCWVEEAQSISKSSLDILIPTIRKENSKIVFTMNRFEESDPVYARFCDKPKDDVLHIYVNYYDNPFCTDVLIKEAQDCKKESPEDYNHIWEGLPLAQGDKKILTIAKVKDAMNRKIKGVGGIELGVDVARFGDDRTVIFKRHGLKVLDYKVHTKLRTYEVANRAIELAGDDKDDCIFKVDDTGVGGGVTDDLYQKEMRVVPVNNGSAAKDENKYPNAISEMWFEFAKIIDTVELPNDQELLKELCGREYGFDKNGRRVVESKDKYKARYKRSPDLADALLLCFYNKYSFDVKDISLGDNMADKYKDL